MRFLAIFLILTPSIAFANTAAPLLPVLSTFSTVLLPIIFIIEAIYYKKFKIPSPFKLSLQTNLISSFVGLILWSILGVTLIKVPFESAAGIRHWMGIFPNRDFTHTIWAMIFMPYIFLIPNCLVSALIEYFSAKKLKTWKDNKLSYMTFLKASALSYLAIALWLFFFITIKYFKML